MIDEILAEVGRRQRNLAAHLRRYRRLIEEQSRKTGASLPPLGPGPNATEDLIGQTQGDCEPLIGSRADHWARIMAEPPAESVLDLAARPKFLVSASGTGQLESGLAGLRRGYPLVHLGVGEAGDLDALTDTGAALMEGRYPVDHGCGTIRANLLVTDPARVVGEAVGSADGSGAWLGHLLWLSDGGAIPELADTDDAVDPDAPDTAAGRFRYALDAVVASRLNTLVTKPSKLPLHTRDAVAGWTAFLRDTEPRLPGVSFAARNLIESLVFGLGQMAYVGDREHHLQPDVRGIGAFARHLVRRMAGVRASLLHAAELEHRRRQIARVFGKLYTATGTLSVRTIYRGLSRISADECRQCLFWLEAEGLVRRSATDSWQLVDGAQLNFDDSTAPLLLVA